MDEPTTHLDIASRELLLKALCNFNGTVMIVSHDRVFEVEHGGLPLAKADFPTDTWHYARARHASNRSPKGES